MSLYGCRVSGISPPPPSFLLFFFPPPLPFFSCLNTSFSPHPPLLFFPSNHSSFFHFSSFLLCTPQLPILSVISSLPYYSNLLQYQSFLPPPLFLLLPSPSSSSLFLIFIFSNLSLPHFLLSPYHFFQNLHHPLYQMLSQIS